jgi:DDE superfamily endonuclease
MRSRHVPSVLIDEPVTFSRLWRSRAQEFRRLLDAVERNVPAGLDAHIVMDNYGTHKTKLIRDWLAKRPRWHVHDTPTSASWINQVARFFAPLTARAPSVASSARSPNSKPPSTPTRTSESGH